MFKFISYSQNSSYDSLTKLSCALCHRLRENFLYQKFFLSQGGQTIQAWGNSLAKYRLFSESAEVVFVKFSTCTITTFQYFWPSIVNYQIVTFCYCTFLELIFFLNCFCHCLIYILCPTSTGFQFWAYIRSVNF